MINCSFENGRKTSLRHVVVDGIVLKDNKVLLVKREEKLLEGGKWGLAGGYVDRDETLREAMQREVFEETGYRVRDIQLLTVNDDPDRPREDRQNISFVFFCTALEKEGKADSESTVQQWFSFEELPTQEEIAFDHYANIQLYLRYQREKLDLPVIK